MAFIEMLDLMKGHKIDTANVNSVEIYDYNFRKSGKVKDSSLIEHRNINYFNTIKYQESYSYSFEYDSLGNEIKKNATSLENGIKHTVHIKKYNKYSKIIELIENNRFGEINSRTVYTYNLRNQLVKKEKFETRSIEKRGILKVLTTFEYNEDKLVKEIELNSYLEGNAFNSKLIREYDPEKRTIFYKSEMLKNDTSETYWWVKSFYTDSGFLVREEQDGSHRNHLQTVYKYDTKGLPIENHTWNLSNKKPARVIKYFYYKEKMGN